VFFKRIIFKPGTPLKSTSFQNDQVATFAVDADTYHGARKRANAIRADAAINGQRLGDDPNNVVISFADNWASSP
jgi:hypothetical protein